MGGVELWFGLAELQRMNIFIASGYPAFQQEEYRGTDASVLDQEALVCSK